MKSTKTFKAGARLESIAQFAKIATDELTGDTGASEVEQSVRITVETFAKPELSIGTLLASFNLESISDEVGRYIDWRRDELKKPINSLRALRVLLRPFASRPAALRMSIVESERHGWTGLFETKDGPKDRTATSEKGGSIGGEW